MLWLRDAETASRSSSREVRIRVPCFSVVYLSRGTLPPKKGNRTLLEDLGMENAAPNITKVAPAAQSSRSRYSLTWRM